MACTVRIQRISACLSSLDRVQFTFIFEICYFSCSGISFLRQTSLDSADESQDIRSYWKQIMKTAESLAVDKFGKGLFPLNGLQTLLGRVPFQVDSLRVQVAQVRPSQLSVVTLVKTYWRRGLLSLIQCNTVIESTQ